MTTPRSVMRAIATARTANEDRRNFEDANAALIEEYRRLCSVEADAIKAVRSAIVTKASQIDEKRIEGFSIRYDTIVDIDKLLALCPDLEDEFELTLPKKKYNALVKAGKIPAEVQEKVESKADTPVITQPSW